MPASFAQLEFIDFTALGYSGFLGRASGKEPSCQCRICKRPWFNPWVGKIPWRRKWQPTPVLLLGESHGGRSLVGYSPWGRKESGTTEWLHFTRELYQRNLFTELYIFQKMIFLNSKYLTKYSDLFWITNSYYWVSNFVFWTKNNSRRTF